MSAATPLRVLALLEATSITGTAKAVVELAYEARADISGQRGLEISVAIFNRGTGEPDNALTRTLTAARIPYSLIREQDRFDASVLPQIRDMARNFNTELIWSNSVKSHFLVKQSGVRAKRKWVAFHHGYTATDFKMRLYNQLDRLSLRRADRVLTVCAPFARQMEARGVSPDRIRVQHMPIRPFTNPPEDALALREELKLRPDSQVILSVGRLSREKGHADLIQAFGRLQGESGNQGLRLVLVGDGPERQELEQLAINLDCHEQTMFLGHRDDAKRFYGIAAVFALPSHTEGTPNVLLEAMAAGVPVVATTVGGVPELAANGRHALLVAARNPVELESALRQLLSAGDLRERLPVAAREVVATHTPRAYFAGMRDIFLEVASE